MADVLVQLNANWRVADDPPQWTIEQRVSKPSGKDSGWRARKFVRGRDHLLRRIGQMCGTVDPKMVETIRSWPLGYVSWKHREIQAPAGRSEGAYSAISEIEAARDTQEPADAADAPDGASPHATAPNGLTPLSAK